MKGCWLVVGHEASAKQLLAVYLALLSSRKQRTLIIQGTMLRNDLFGLVKNNIVRDAILDNIVITNFDEQNETSIQAGLKIFYEPPRLPYCKGNCIVFSTPPLRIKPHSPWRKVVIKKMHGHEYLLKTSNSFTRIIISPEYIGVSKEPTGILGRALNLLRNAVIDYGSLTLRDAIDILAYNLGIKRSDARNLLGLLVEKKYVVIDKNNIIVY